MTTATLSGHVRLPPQEITARQIEDVTPAIIAIEFDGSRSSERAGPRAPMTGVRAAAGARAIPIPVIVDGHGLSATEHESKSEAESRMSARETYIAVKGQHPEMASRLSSRRPGPKSGDVLVSRPTARADVYRISVIPTGAHMIAVRYEDAMQKAREVARGLAVDGWYTCDHIHSSIERSVTGTMPSVRARPGQDVTFESAFDLCQHSRVLARSSHVTQSHLAVAPSDAQIGFVRLIY